jgi:hypothetical protein
VPAPALVDDLAEGVELELAAGFVAGERTANAESRSQL